MDMRTAILTVAALGLVTMAIGAPGANAETQIPDDETYPGHCMHVYLFVAHGPYTTVDASNSCPNVVVHDDEACQDLADSNTLLEHEGDCEFDVDRSILECPGPLCVFPIDGGSLDTVNEPPKYCVYPWGC